MGSSSVIGISEMTKSSVLFNKKVKIEYFQINMQSHFYSSFKNNCHQLTEEMKSCHLSKQNNKNNIPCTNIICKTMKIHTVSRGAKALNVIENKLLSQCWCIVGPTSRVSHSNKTTTSGQRLVFAEMRRTLIIQSMVQSRCPRFELCFWWSQSCLNQASSCTWPFSPDFSMLI